MPRLAAALCAALLLAACSEEVAQECPGEPVASLRFAGTRVFAGDPALDGLDPAPAVPDCGPEVGYEQNPPPIFDGTLAADPASGAAALCPSRGLVLFGERSGARFTVETGTDGAVLCGSTCGAALRLVVAGDLATDAGGEPVAFQGVLVEVMTRVEGDCGGCLPPPGYACAARFALTGVP